MASRLLHRSGRVSLSNSTGNRPVVTSPWAQGTPVRDLGSGQRHGRRRRAAPARPPRQRQRPGRGGADIDGLYAIARSCPPTLAGLRGKALVLTGFHYACRASEPARLLTGDMTLHPPGMQVAHQALGAQREILLAGSRGLPRASVDRLPKPAGRRTRGNVGQPLHPCLRRHRPVGARHRRNASPTASPAPSSASQSNPPTLASRSARVDRPGRWQLDVCRWFRAGAGGAPEP